MDEEAGFREGERNKLIAVEVARNVELWRKAMEFILTKLASVSMYETTYNIPKEIVRAQLSISLGLE